MSDTSDNEEEKFETGRDGIIFLIEATESMFIEDDSGDCAFRQCLRACDKAMLHKIKFSDLDLLGIVFFGTDATINDGKRNHISIFQALQRPGSDSVRPLRKMHQSSTLGDFETKYGHNEDFLLADVLWLAQSMLSKNKVKMASSRIILLACSEVLGKDDSHSQRQANSCAKDLHGNSISLEFVPCVPHYCPSDFVKTVIQIASGQNDPWTIPKPYAVNSLEDIPNIVESIAGSKDQRSRCVGNLDFRIGENVSVGVEVYNLVRPDAGPKKDKLYRSTNEKVTSKVIHQVSVVKTEINDEEDDDDDPLQAPTTSAVVHEGEQRTVKKMELDKIVTIGEETVRLSQEEYDMMNKIIEPSLVLLGFVPVSFLKITHHCNSASLVYPSKSSSQGSRDLFTSLWHRMGVKDVAAICTFTLRRGCHPRFAALVPSGLEKDHALLKEYRKFRIHAMPDPQGFHIFLFPFKDNINSLNLPQRPSASSEQVSLAVSLLKKLRSVFHPSRMPNPAAEAQWAAIEAVELESESFEMPEDAIRPDYDTMDERLGETAMAFISSVYREEYDPTAKIVKKSSGARATKHPFSELDMDVVDLAIKNHKVQELNMDKLKGYLKAKGHPVSGKRKQDLVNDIYKFRFS